MFFSKGNYLKDKKNSAQYSETVKDFLSLVPPEIILWYKTGFCKPHAKRNAEHFLLSFFLSFCFAFVLFFILFFEMCQNSKDSLIKILQN